MLSFEKFFTKPVKVELKLLFASAFPFGFVYVWYLYNGLYSTILLNLGLYWAYFERLLFPLFVIVLVKLLHYVINNEPLHFPKVDFRDVKFYGLGLALAIITKCFLLSVPLGLGQVSYYSTEFYVESFIYILVIHISVGFWEEFIWRGFVLQTFLKNNINPSLSVFTVALLFSCYHWQIWQFDNWNIFLNEFMVRIHLGLWFGFAYLITKSIATPIALHTTWNICSLFWQGTENHPGFIVFFGTDTYNPGLDSVTLVIISVLFFFTYFFKESKTKFT